MRRRKALVPIPPASEKLSDFESIRAAFTGGKKKFRHKPLIPKTFP